MIHRGSSCSAICTAAMGARPTHFCPTPSSSWPTLQNYVRRGFTYVEVGDGDEMWKGWPFEEIRHAHQRVFDLFHDLEKEQPFAPDPRQPRRQTKGAFSRTRTQEHKDGLLPVHEGLIFRHQQNGKQLFAVHGHQADILCDPMYFFSRRAARFGYRLRDFLKKWQVPASLEREKGKLEHRIIDWIDAHSQIVICGHTHRMSFPFNGSPPYLQYGQRRISLVGSLDLRLKMGRSCPFSGSIKAERDMSASS